MYMQYNHECSGRIAAIKAGDVIDMYSEEDSELNETDDYVDTRTPEEIQADRLAFTVRMQAIRRSIQARIESQQTAGDVG